MLKWVFERVDGDADAVETPIGLPARRRSALDTDGPRRSPTTTSTTLLVGRRRRAGGQPIPQIREHYAQFGDRLPEQLRDELASLEKRLAATG